MFILQSDIKPLLKSANGKIFGIQFIKKDKSLRHMTARLGVKKYLHGGVSTTKKFDNFIDVFEMNSGYRKINLNTVITITMNNVDYMVKRD